jgi:hypothetical protein
LDAKRAHKMNNAKPLRKCKRQLIIIWLSGAGLAFTLLVVQTVGGVFGGAADKAWGWFVPTILPTLSVIVGAVTFDARAPQDHTLVDSTAFLVSTVLSIFYLGLMLATILLRPLANVTPLQFLDTSNLWLGPAQGLVGLSLGAFFTSAQTRRSQH